MRLESHFFLFINMGLYINKVFRCDKVYGLAKHFNIKRTCTIICEDISLLNNLSTGFLQIYVGLFKFY